MSEPSLSLDALRGPHATFLSFSPAPSLAMFLIGALLGGVAAILLRKRIRGRRALRREALTMLDDARPLPPPDRLAAQAALLRRVVKTIDGDGAAALRDADWLARLDALFATTFFTAGAGRCFGDALYGRAPSDDVDAVERGLRRCVARLKR